METVICRLARRGGAQALEIPAHMTLDSDEVVLRREGAALVVEPIQKPSLLEVLATLEPLDEQFPDVDNDLPPLDETTA